ncbi:hypothetical protein [Candidatus Rariloculus sp.]|uniref:hypothetical protein n=1 Tax=Candidatus Rariloculus sp. TaxID=3101265 RepID=UPI003D0EF461
MTVEDNIASGENLGRSVLSSGQAKRAGRLRVPFHLFLEKEGETRLSVDRLDVAPPGESVEIADRMAAARHRTFYGWAVVVFLDASAKGRRVIASPLLDNPYHVDIVLPDSTIEDREEQKRHAQELADASTWRGRATDD